MSGPFVPSILGEEDALHRSRLLNTEERAFRRVTKRLLAPDTFSHLLGRKLAEQNGDYSTEAKGEEGQRTEQPQRKIEEYEKLREDILTDFAAFEANIIRTQLLLNSNAQERERYAIEKLRIQETAQQVRENTGELRKKLEEAQRTMEQRRGWDMLAEKITNNRMLRTREEQHANIEKLNNEIAELEQESRDYAKTWAERREQFDRIVNEGSQMLRLIRDEKEEVERREGMEENEEGDDADHGRGGASNVGTPRPEGGATPLHPGVEGEQTDGMLHPRSKTPLRGSPAPEIEEHVQPPSAQGDDADMADEGEVEDNDSQDGGTEAVSSERADAETTGEMDTS